MTIEDRIPHGAHMEYMLDTALVCVELDNTELFIIVFQNRVLHTSPLQQHAPGWAWVTSISVPSTVHLHNICCRRTEPNYANRNMYNRYYQNVLLKRYKSISFRQWTEQENDAHFD